MIARADHTNGFYRDDNAQVYYKLEEATRGTQYAATIKPFQRRRNGRAYIFGGTEQKNFANYPKNKEGSLLSGKLSREKRRVMKVKRVERIEIIRRKERQLLQQH